MADETILDMLPKGTFRRGYSEKPRRYGNDEAKGGGEENNVYQGLNTLIDPLTDQSMVIFNLDKEKQSRRRKYTDNQQAKGTRYGTKFDKRDKSTAILNGVIDKNQHIINRIHKEELEEWGLPNRRGLQVPSIGPRKSTTT